jgi:hypothetical protein
MSGSLSDEQPVLEFCGFKVPDLEEHSEKNMGHWHKYASEMTQMTLASSIGDLLTNPDKALLDSKLKDFKLPVAQKIMLGTQEFLSDPEKQLENISSSGYSLRLTNTQDTNSRRTEFFKKGDLVDFESLLDGYDTVRITETYPPLLSGTIRTDGQAIHMESALGYVGRVIHDGEVDFKVDRDNFSPFFHYRTQHQITTINGERYQAGSEPPEQIRQNLYKVMSYISIKGSGVELSFRPGYYEFGLVDQNDNQQYTPMFWDWTENKFYNDINID